jgi:Mrp family chromosome partitioning ATPase
MGRILDTLKQTGHRGPATEPTPLPPHGAPDAGPGEESSSEIPFIEVGGRGTTVEASTKVLAGMPTAGRLAGPLLAKPLTVAYQPWAAPSFPETAPQRLAPPLIAFHQPDHAVSGQYRSLLANLTAQCPGRDARVFLLLAPTSGTGTTTVLLNLAITRAKHASKPVVVVDANLRRPALAEMLGLSPEPGLREVAARGVPLAVALKETAQAGLMALTAGEATPSPSAWPAADGLRAVLQQLRQHFEWVLIDAPSWDGGPEMVALSSACDAIYLVLRPTEVNTPAVSELGRLIPHLGSRLGGYILTQR